jgi:predicted DNA-binding antitoxin AbrB/MazE fold protein
MTITIDATYEDGVLKPAQPLALREHERVRVTVEQQDQRPADEDSTKSRGPSLAEEILALTRALPPGALDSLPDDLASEHDHYLYGTPKRFE